MEGRGVQGKAIYQQQEGPEAQASAQLSSNDIVLIRPLVKFLTISEF